jgi:beclin 1
MVNEVFTISTNEELGTISGFRFGRLPTIDVKWEEINAAVGQSVYLMIILAHRFSFKVDRYDVSLCGAYSKISLKPPSQKQVKCELYMPTNEDRYNQGLIYVLDILKSLTNHVDG